MLWSSTLQLIKIIGREKGSNRTGRERNKNEKKMKREKWFVNINEVWKELGKVI